MSRFPGSTYAGDGRSLARGEPDLTITMMSRYRHRGIVSRTPGAEIIRIWCLATTVDFEAIPFSIMDQAIEFVLAGSAVLLLARRPEPLFDVREMTLASVLIAESLHRRRLAA